MRTNASKYSAAGSAIERTLNVFISNVVNLSLWDMTISNFPTWRPLFSRTVGRLNCTVCYFPLLSNQDSEILNIRERRGISYTKGSQMQLIWWRPWVHVSRNRIDVPDVSSELSLSLNLTGDCPRLITAALRLCLFDRRKHDGAIALSQHLRK